MTRRSNIGFDRPLELDWLDAAAGHAAAGATAEEMRDYLRVLLTGVVSGEARNSARGKTLTVLNHIWGDVPKPARALRARAAARLADCSADERLALHWAMMIATYPFFTDLAASIGRLLSLRGDFTLALVTRRLVASWGERSTLDRATRRLVGAMVQWGVVRRTTGRGTYEALSRRRIGAGVGTLMIEALLVDAEESSVSIEQLVRHPALFPFDVQVGVSDLRRVPQFSVHRQGLGTEVVELRDRGLE